ncbi:MAG: hypothetical protein SVN78_01310 [Deferribacterota bacterium]|nr:hypothetical protein [Deferribacterota bacterium]
MTTSSNRIYLKDNRFYKIIDSKHLEEIDIEYLKESIFQLIIDDSYFFYDSLELPTTNKRKLRAIIKNYLLTNYPEELIKYFSYININNKTIIYIINNELIELTYKYTELFKLADRISTPLLEALSLYNNFTYKTKNIIYEIENMQIKHLNKDSGNVLTADDIIYNLQNINLDIDLLIKKENALLLFKKYRIPIVLLTIAYVLFVAGEIIKINTLENRLEKYNNLLIEIYRDAGVLDSSDPLGLLLSKVNSDNNNNKIILPTIYKISKAVDNNTTIDSININFDTIRFDGITQDYKSLEEITSNLEKETGKHVTILNTNKEKEYIKFSIRIG